MKTKKQQELAESFLSELSDELRPLYRELIWYLSEIGYNPHKQRSYIVFKHTLHNKQMAKTGINIYKPHNPFFALRFSACRDYSQRFADIVRDSINKQQPYVEPNCIAGACDYCAGTADSHVYTHVFPDGGIKFQCGAGALEIPDITADDVDEIKKLIKEEHEYLLKHQAGISES
jgi:hypothetical protein